MTDAAGSLALRVSIRRQLEAPEALIAREVQLPLRILYIVSRPEDAGFIDPRVTTKALFAAIDPLGAAVKLDFCRPPTLTRMGEMLREAQQAGDGYDVLHFDGHGTFLQQQQLGGAGNHREKWRREIHAPKNFIEGNLAYPGRNKS